MLSYVQGKVGLPPTIPKLPEKLPPVNCPYCMATPVMFVPVSAAETLRSYDDSPRAMEARLRLLHRIGSNLKIGDSFEHMRSKMVSFDEQAAEERTINRTETNESINESTGPQRQCSIRIEIIESFDNLQILPSRPNTSYSTRSQDSHHSFILDDPSDSDQTESNVLSLDNSLPNQVKEPEEMKLERESEEASSEVVQTFNDSANPSGESSRRSTPDGMHCIQ